MLDRLREETAAMTGRIKLPGATATTETPWSALLAFAAVVLAASVLLSGCNTLEGVGEDVEAAGEEVDEAF